MPVEEDESTEEEEEGDGSSDESGSSDSEPEQPQKQTQTPAKPQQPPPPQPQSQPQQASSSSDEEDSGSETESDSDEPDSKAKPIASKPVVEAQKASNGPSKARSKPVAPDPVTPTKSAAAKRPAEDSAAKDGKKAKKTDEGEASEKKSNLFQRLWSEEDEIVILEGMIDYTSKKKADPVADLSAFLDFIKQKLHIDVTRTQLQDKIRRLKKKFENNKSKEKEGEQRTFSKPHELKAYDLSKLIWGNETVKENGGAKVVGSPKSNGRVARKTDGKKANAGEREEAKDVKPMVFKEDKLPAAERLNSDSVGWTVEERMLTAGRGLEGKEEWEKLKEEEFELYLKQLEVKVAQTKLVLDFMKGRNH